MQGYFYILYSQEAGRYYLGHTTEPLEERLRKHNSNHKGFTGKHHDWQLVYWEKYETKNDAYRRELQVKNWKSSKRLKELIERASEHPDS